MREIEFISYDGAYPNLCRGTLVFVIGGERRTAKYCLSSGGSVWFDDDRSEHVESGPWNLDDNDAFSDMTLAEKERLLVLIDEHVEQGCCGGCI